MSSWNVLNQASFVCPIIKHGTDDSRAQAKILARNQVMQSMKGGFFEESD